VGEGVLVTSTWTGLDRIAVTGITARGFHGVLEHEKREGQTFVVDVALGVDTREAARTDDLARTVDYSAVAADVVAIVSDGSLDLIETLAQRIADACLARDLVEAVEVVVHKPDAPVGVPFDDVTVTIVRGTGAR
jgi:dihydroneopterin aldolase